MKPYLFTFGFGEGETWEEIHEAELALPNKAYITEDDVGGRWPDDVGSFIAEHTGAINASQLASITRCHYKNKGDAALSPCLAVPDV